MGKKKKLKIFEVRKSCARKGGAHLRYHAEIIASHYTQALQAAREGRVGNWRNVDSFGISREEYQRFNYLGIVSEKQAKRPEKPRAKK